MQQGYFNTKRQPYLKNVYAFNSSISLKIEGGFTTVIQANNLSTVAMFSVM